ncbi:MAG: hypothetical protein U1E69_13500 [Tabrizicola sp.]|uniref:hypothetical protein n=1 Tax=Tabrizicola sp. TaxID=2005166 RepID=UPI002ABC9A1E|nr:hypothetical protein [Tabrizicola sp.]MDZ4087803.1 hypothetical protein [Tabrizicola sp.]
MSANDTARLRDFPAVFLSYDEPWADRNWLDLKAILPRAVRVHGVKGLDACHKAAAAAVPGDWVVTVDADTRISPALADAPVDASLLTGNFRLDWLARNVVNGLWSGNGCVKLWPKALIAEMRTHEAAPDGTLSLDHDVAAIRHGKSAQVTMPERAVRTDPAATAFHAFRAGLRETAFLRSLAEQSAQRQGKAGWQSESDLLRLIMIWCMVGRQALNGRWMLYGARLGMALADLWPDWDLRQINDHDAISQLWTQRIQPRFQRGRPRSNEGVAWNWAALEADLAELARRISDLGGPELPELDAAKSGALARTDLLASPVRPARLDALGVRLLAAARTPEAKAVARAVLEQAAIQGHPAAHFNLGRLLERPSSPDPARAAWHLAVAARLGNAAAQTRLQALRTEGADLPTARLAAELPLVRPGAKGATRPTGATLCLALDKGVTLLPQAALHVPDPALVSAGTVLGYLSICPVTGLPRPRGIRLTRADRLAEPAAAVLPLVLGSLPPPQDAATALQGGLADPLADLPPVLATLGRDAPFGDHWVLGSLLARLGHVPRGPELQQLATRSPQALDTQIVSLARQLELQADAEVPVWSAAESRAVKRKLPLVASRAAWVATANALSGLGPTRQRQAALFHAAARSIWGDDPVGR